jgi:hypothetical protein
VGLENAKNTDVIVRFLNDRGYEISRGKWEIDVMGKLRDEGVFIASHKTKGMYLIQTREEAEKFYLQYANRITKQNARLEFLRMLIDYADW